MSNNKSSIIRTLINVDFVKKNILPLYNLDKSEVSMIKFKDTDKQRVVFKVTCANNTYCLKKVYYNEENLLFVYSAMEWLYRHNVKVPKLLPSNNSSRFIAYDNMLFILTPWVNGIKCDFDNEYHRKLSAKTLAKLHKTTHNFVPIEGSLKRVGLDDYHTTVNKHFNEILNSANLAAYHNDKFSKIFLDNLDYNLELAKHSLELSSSIDKSELSISLCHGDYVNKNILIDNSTVWVIDFDKCKFDYCAHDIAYFLRRLLKRPDTNWDIDLTLNFLDNYMYLNPLNSSDLKYILSYLAFPQKYWKVSRDYYKNIKKCNKNSFIALFTKGLERSYNQLEYINKMIVIFENNYHVKF